MAILAVLLLLRTSYTHKSGSASLLLLDSSLFFSLPTLLSPATKALAFLRSAPRTTYPSFRHSQLVLSLFLQDLYCTIFKSSMVASVTSWAITTVITRCSLALATHLLHTSFQLRLFNSSRLLSSLFLSADQTLLKRLTWVTRSLSEADPHDPHDPQATDRLRQRQTPPPPRAPCTNHSRD